MNTRHIILRFMSTTYHKAPQSPGLLFFLSLGFIFRTVVSILSDPCRTLECPPCFFKNVKSAASWSSDEWRAHHWIPSVHNEHWQGCTHAHYTHLCSFPFHTPDLNENVSQLKSHQIQLNDFNFTFSILLFLWSPSKCFRLSSSLHLLISEYIAESTTIILRG